MLSSSKNNQSGNQGIIKRYFLLFVFFFSIVNVGGQRIPWQGKVSGVESFELFDTVDTEPIQNWYCVGNSPEGMIYIGGMDHKQNSILYEFNPDINELSYAGDAKSAAKAANNLEVGETFEKFHCIPTYLDGKMYVASMDYSSFDDGYKNRRGFHWFSYNPSTKEMIDVTASSAGNTSGVAAAHAQATGIFADTSLHMLYALGLPTGHLYSYSNVKNEVKDYGPPPFDFPDEYPAISVFGWTGDDGKAYFSYQGGLDSMYSYVYYLDPETETYGIRKDWIIQGDFWLKDPENPSNHNFGPKRFTMGAWTKNREKCYVTNRLGNIHEFSNNGPEWRYVGKASFPFPFDQSTFVTRSMTLSKDEKKIYFINDHWDDTCPGFFILEYDIEKDTTLIKAKLSQLDSRLSYGNGPLWHGGTNVWDDYGYFYFVSFAWNEGNVICTRINPDKIPEVNTALPAFRNELDTIYLTTGEVLNLPYNEFIANLDGIYEGIPVSVKTDIDDLLIVTGQTNQNLRFYVKNNYTGSTPIKLYLGQKGRMIDSTEILVIVEPSGTTPVSNIYLDNNNRANKWKMEIYPNPANEWIKLQFESLPNLDVQLNVHIFNSTGRMLTSQIVYMENKYRSENIMTVDLPKGLYLVVVSSGDYRVSRKVLLE
jgi:hypothetical protein